MELHIDPSMSVPALLVKFVLQVGQVQGFPAGQNDQRLPTLLAAGNEPLLLCRGFEAAAEDVQAQLPLAHAYARAPRALQHHYEQHGCGPGSVGLGFVQATSCTLVVAGRHQPERKARTIISPDCGCAHLDVGPRGGGKAITLLAPTSACYYARACRGSVPCCARANVVARAAPCGIPWRSPSGGTAGSRGGLL